MIAIEGSALDAVALAAAYRAHLRDIDLLLDQADQLVQVGIVEGAMALRFAVREILLAIIPRGVPESNHGIWHPWIGRYYRLQHDLVAAVQALPRGA